MIGARASVLVWHPPRVLQGMEKWIDGLVTYSRQEQLVDNDKGKSIPIALVATSLVLGVFVVSLPTAILLQGIISDDAFYYFKIAQNVVLGRGFTFDTINSTNGFQPLWQLSLIPIFYLFREPLMLPVRVTLSLQIAFLILSALLTWRMLRGMHVGNMAAFTASMVWVTFPSIFACIVSGLEGGLYAVLLTLSTWYYAENFRAASGPASFSQKSVLGLLLGLTFLARTEAGFFALIVLIDLFVLQIRQRRIRHLPVLYPVVLASGLLAVPYLVWNLSTYGHPVPISGRVKAFLSAQQLGAIEKQGTIPLVYRILQRWKSTDPIYEGAEVAVKVVRILLDKLSLPTEMAPVLFVLAVIGLILWFLREPLLKRLAKLQPFAPLVAFAAVTCVYYNVCLFGRQRYWYFIPQMVLSCIGIALLLDSLWERVKVFQRSSLRLGTSLFVCLLSLAAFGGWLIRLQVTPSFSGATYPYRYDVAQWLQRNTAADTRIGVWNAGMVGYFSRRAVINLDGLVNSPAYFQRIKEQTVVSYLKEQEVDFVADYFYEAPFAKSMLSRYDQPDCWQEHLELVLRIPGELTEGRSQWYIWRFCPDSCNK